MFSGIQSQLFDDPDFKEDSVREIVVVPILSKLGYLPTGRSKVIRSKALKHPYIRVGTRNYPVTMIPDYTLLYDEKPIFVLDAKGPKESILKVEHIQQAYSYAIHPEIKCREFGLCNGRQLAIFNVDQREPVLVLDFDEYEFRWIEIEKYLSPKYLLKPGLRRYSPDFGFKLSRLGIDRNTDLIMLGVRLNLFARINDELFSASANCDFGDVEHCVSFDFPSVMLKKIVFGLPEPLGEMFFEALNRAPFQASAGLVIELDLTAMLGEETQGREEKFIPLLIKEIHESRFNPSLVENDPNDIPSHVFQLRKAFKLVIE
jgi:hypothetical protein